LPSESTLAQEVAPHADAVESARLAGLRYVSDAAPGIRRRRSGKSFAYLGVDGKPVRDAATLGRIRSLAIPPAWNHVWICPISHGHLQATGRDARGRKQYRYHPRWKEVRDEAKYGRLIAFGEALPKLRRQVQRDLATPGLPRQRVLAAVVQLLDFGRIRIGNGEYVRQNNSYGLTTLRDRHVKVSRGRLRFRFRAKSGKLCNVELHDRRLARIVNRCQELPGQELFQYIDEEEQPSDVASEHVNEYVRSYLGEEFTAKDFRTWTGTLLAARALARADAPRCESHARQQVATAIKQVAEQLCNTPAVCRACYVHPAVIDAYMRGNLGPMPVPGNERARRWSAAGLSREERALLRLLRAERARAESRALRSVHSRSA
jgi:DNA topoisomerase-1